MGKGDHTRPSSVSKEEYDANFEAVFGKKKLNVWENPPRIHAVDEEDRADGGQLDEVLEEPGGQPHREASETVEGAWCPCCCNGKVVQDPHWSGRIVCENCQSNWDKSGA